MRLYKSLAAFVFGFAALASTVSAATRTEIIEQYGKPVIGNVTLVDPAGVTLSAGVPVTDSSYDRSVTNTVSVTDTTYDRSVTNTVAVSDLTYDRSVTNTVSVTDTTYDRSVTNTVNVAVTSEPIYPVGSFIQVYDTAVRLSANASSYSATENYSVWLSCNSDCIWDFVWPNEATSTAQSKYDGYAFAGTTFSATSGMAGPIILPQGTGIVAWGTSGTITARVLEKQ